MYLEKSLPPPNRQQTLVKYRNVGGTEIDVHPTGDSSKTFGWQVVSKFNCDPSAAAGSTASTKKKGGGRSERVTEGGDSSSRKKKLRTQKRQKRPKVTVEIVPYQP